MCIRDRTRGKLNKTWGLDQFQCWTGQCIPGKWKGNILSDWDDGTSESPECVPSVRHPELVQCTITQKCIPAGWIYDGEPDYGVSEKQIINNSDEDPHRYFSYNTTYGTETYWCIKQYDKGNYMSFVAVSYTHLDVYKRQL